MFSTAWDSTLSHWAAAFIPHTQWSFWEGRSFWKKLACSQWQRRPAGQIHKQINACLTLGLTSTPLFCAPGSPFPWHFLTPHLPQLGRIWITSILTETTITMHKIWQEGAQGADWRRVKPPVQGMGRWGGGGPWGPFGLEPHCRQKPWPFPAVTDGHSHFHARVLGGTATIKSKRTHCTSSMWLLPCSSHLALDSEELGWGERDPSIQMTGQRERLS